MSAFHSWEVIFPISFSPPWEIVEGEEKKSKQTNQALLVYPEKHGLWETPGPATMEKKNKDLCFNITKQSNAAKTHCILSLINPP